jgi:chromosomal replication initiation ATPase DnaA
MSAPPYLTPEDLWSAALAELKEQITKATYHDWLAGSHVLAQVSTPEILVILVRNQYAQAWLMHQLQTVIARTLDCIAGHSVDFYFVPENYTKGVAGNSLEERLLIVGELGEFH